MIVKKIKESLSIDKKLNNKRSYAVLKWYRLEHKAYVENKKVKLKILSMLKEIVFLCLRIDAQISYKAQIGDNIRILHSGGGVVISSKAIIHDYQTIYHQVTIGINENLPEKDQPIIIEENCYLSCGCKIISCRIGKNSKIGPNAVVYKDIPEGSLFINIGDLQMHRY